MKPKTYLIGSALIACLSTAVFMRAQPASPSQPWIDWGTQPAGNTSSLCYSMTCDSGSFPGPDSTFDALLVKPGTPSNLVVTLSTNAAKSTWQQVGLPFSASPASLPSIAVTSDSIFVANNEVPINTSTLNGTPGIYAYKKSDGLTGSWKSITGSLTGAQICDVRLALSGTTLYLLTMSHKSAFQPGKVDNGINVYTYNNSEWLELPGAGIPRGKIQSAWLQISPDGTPYLEYRSNLTYIVVKKFSRGAWQTVTPGEGFNEYAVSAGLNVMSIDSNGAVSVICVNSKGQPQVKTYTKGTDGSYAWIDLGGSFATQPDRPQIVNMGSFGPWVFYRSSVNPHQVEVKQFLANSWVPVGMAGSAKEPISLMLAGSSNAMLSFLSYSSQLSGYDVYLQTYP